jgi:hypothetical protein
MTRPIAAVALLLSLAAPLRAQQAACFRGRPLPHCRTFWLTEFGVSPFDGMFGWELGGMRNLGTHSAVGGTLYLRVDGGTAYGVKPRFRRWLSPVVALDVSPGVIILAGARNSVGFAGHAGVSLGDLLAFTLQAETVPPGFDAGKRIRLSGGARLGAGPGAITGIAGLALLAVYAVACGGGTCLD